MTTRACANDQKAVDVQALVADTGVKRLDVAVAPRLARWDEVQTNLPSRPVGHCAASQFRSVVAPQYCGMDTS